MGGGAVDRDDPGPALAGQDVGLEAAAVVDIGDGDLLAHPQSAPLHEVDVDGDAPFII
jgi:hypothetical protein